MVDKYGSPKDRGSADRYYHRSAKPHKLVLIPAAWKRVEDMSDQEVREYMDGYRKEEDQKDFG
jgi:hypothetical protein